MPFEDGLQIKFSIPHKKQKKKKMVDLRTCEVRGPLGRLSYESRNYQFQVFT